MSDNNLIFINIKFKKYNDGNDQEYSLQLSLFGIIILIINMVNSNNYFAYAKINNDNNY
jgi:hypothetical protein